MGKSSRQNSAPFLIGEIDLSKPEVVEVPLDCYGIGVVIRERDEPVGFCLKALEPGSKATSAEIVAWAAEGDSAVILPDVNDEPATLSAFPTLTIAICTRNRPEWLARCLSYILRVVSGEAGVEVIVVDNAPSDRRSAEVTHAHSGVRYVVEAVPGLDFARNRALAEAQGELIAFIDDDAALDARWLAGLRRSWHKNPDAGCFTGPILPLQLQTGAQVLFEMQGGFGRSFRPARYVNVSGDDPVYPCHAGIFGSGCNMVFNRDLIRDLGGFDEALDTGPPLPAAGDLDMFYRVIAADRPLVYAPQMVIFHDHRRDYAALRKQIWTWGLGLMAYADKYKRRESPHAARFRLLIRSWFVGKLRGLLHAVKGNGNGWPADLIGIEIIGGIVGLMGEYNRSVRRVARRRAAHSQRG